MIKIVDKKPGEIREMEVIGSVDDKYPILFTPATTLSRKVLFAMEQRLNFRTFRKRNLNPCW